jgi:hypothetical protein
VNYHEIHKNPMRLAFDEKENMVVGFQGLVGKNAYFFACHKLRGEIYLALLLIAKDEINLGMNMH